MSKTRMGYIALRAAVGILTAALAFAGQEVTAGDLTCTVTRNDTTVTVGSSPPSGHELCALCAGGNGLCDWTDQSVISWQVAAQNVGETFGTATCSFTYREDGETKYWSVNLSSQCNCSVPGELWDEGRHACIDPSDPCPADWDEWDADRQSCVPSPCPEGQSRDVLSHACVANCAHAEQVYNPVTKSCDWEPCTNGYARDVVTGICDSVCPYEGQTLNAGGTCDWTECPWGQVRCATSQPVAFACQPIGLCASSDRDTDGDGISDGVDTDDDGDGIPDTEDPDSHTCPVGWSWVSAAVGCRKDDAPLDTDGDGNPDASDPDDDGDGISDESDPDADGDGESDAAEDDAGASGQDTGDKYGGYAEFESQIRGYLGLPGPTAGAAEGAKDRLESASAVIAAGTCQSLTVEVLGRPVVFPGDVGCQRLEQLKGILGFLIWVSLLLYALNTVLQPRHPQMSLPL